MAYALRYYKEIAQADGGVVRLEIHKKDSTTAAVEIGAVVQGLSLEIQGQQDDIDSPIQKTSLHMTFVDASDIENGQKNGFWQEFYTPDALMWKVILKAKDATETSFRTIWGGYVTPDSFSEDLVYRGSVSITARDNIGHMQDFPFDAEGDADGMISLYNLVESGWEKIQSPMMLEWRGAAESTMWLMCDGVSAMFTLMNVSMFEGMDWYKAIETALASYGVVMRYVGNNIVKMSSLRSMPYQGEEFIEDLIHIEPTFVSGATRELIPAVKRIEERVEYDVTDSVTAPQLKSDDFTGESSSVVLSTSTGSQFTLEGWSIKNTERGEGWMNNVGNPPSYFFPEAYDLSLLADADSRDDEFMWFAFSQYATGDNRYAVYSRRMMPCAITMRLAFGSPYRLVNRVLTPVGNARADYAMIAIEVIADGVSYFLQKNGGWGNNLDLLTYNNEQVSNGELVIDIPTDGFNQSIILNVRIYEAGYDSWAQDTYIPLYSLDFSANNVVMEKNSVNTNYNAENNVILSRDPEIGPAYDRVALPAFIKNGIFYRSGNAILPAKKWSWGSGSEQQMAVFNHLQLLSYYAKPNNLISGTIVNADITRAQAIYVWHGAEHILVSGRYNFLNGHIESAVLREFARYEDMWSEVAGADLPDTEQDSRSNVEGGSASGGSSSTYSNTTTVNIGGGGGGGTGASNLNDLLDVDTAGVVAQSVLYYNGTSWVDMSLNTLLNPYLKADVAAQTYASKSALGSLAYKNGLTASDIPDLSGKYLSTAGGTITGVLTISDKSTAQNPFLWFSINNSVEAGIGYYADYGTYLYNGESGKILGIFDNGIPHFNFQPLLHSGNVGDYALKYYANQGAIDFNDVLYNGIQYVSSYSSNAPATRILVSFRHGDSAWQIAGGRNDNLLQYRGSNGISDSWSAWKTIAFTDSDITGKSGDSDKLGGVAPSGYAKNLLGSSMNIDDIREGLSGGKLYRATGTFPTDTYAYASLLEYGSSGYAGQFTNWYNDLYFRGCNGRVWKDWKQIAFTDSNVASATKLATARTLWGQSFDGTGDIESPAKMQILRFVNIDGSAGSYIGRGAGNHNGIFVYIPTADDFSIYTKGEQRMLISSSGNVLIGTTNDNGAKLQVANSDNAVSQMSFTNNAMTGFVGVDEGGLFMYHHTNKDIRFHTYGAERMRITSGGNVLIGKTSDDGGKLQISSASANIISLYRTTSGGGALVDYFANNETTNQWRVGHNYGSAGSSFVFNKFDGTTESTKMLINSSGNVTIGAIDLASVGYKLFVDGILGIGGSGNSQWVTRFVSNSEIGLDIQLGRNANNDKLPFSIAWRNDLGTPPFTINPSGNVGIGNVNPAYKLDVNGDVGISSTNGSIEIDNGRVIGNATLTMQAIGTTHARIQTSHFGVAYTCPLYINPSGGNVLIGTTTDIGCILSIYSNGSNGRVNIYSSDTEGLGIGQWDGVTNRIESYGRPLLITSYSNPIKFGFNGDGNAMTINSSGNVLIGTTTDNGAKLQVAGGITTSGMIQLTHITIDSGNDIYSDNGLFIQPYGGGDVNINYLGTNTILNVNTGNVGIGIATPEHKLDVYGSARIIGSASILGAVSMSSTLNVGGNTTINGNLVVAGDISA